MPTTQPASLDAERYLLGVLLRDGLPLPITEVTPLDFFSPTHSDIASAIVSLTEQEKQIDELTVSEVLKVWGTPIEYHALDGLIKDVGFSPLNRSWAVMIRRDAHLRRILAVTSRATEALQSPDPDPKAIIGFVADGMKELSADLKTAKGTGPQKMELESLQSFDRENDPDCVLGNRWLCKGGSLLIVGQSGTGKSSLMMQAAVHWAVGRDFFGIDSKGKRPLRIAIVQSENDKGDISEAFQDVSFGASLNPTERQLLFENLAIYRDTTSVGKAFPGMLKDLITAHRADIVFIDPLLSFAGINVSDQEQVTHFLRHDLAPILLETGAILIAMHHTGKPMKASDKEGQTIADLAYAGFGSSEFTNYFRESAFLFRVAGETPVYRFGLTKRRGRSNLKNADGNFSPEILIRHAREKGAIRWEYASPSDLPQPDTDSSPAKGSPRRFNRD